MATNSIGKSKTIWKYTPYKPGVPSTDKKITTTGTGKRFLTGDVGSSGEPLIGYAPTGTVIVQGSKSGQYGVPKGTGTIITNAERTGWGDKNIDAYNEANKQRNKIQLISSEDSAKMSTTGQPLISPGKQGIILTTTKNQTARIEEFNRKTKEQGITPGIYLGMMEGRTKIVRVDSKSINDFNKNMSEAGVDAKTYLEYSRLRSGLAAQQPFIEANIPAYETLVFDKNSRFNTYTGSTGYAPKGTIITRKGIQNKNQLTWTPIKEFAGQLATGTQAINKYLKDEGKDFLGIGSQQERAEKIKQYSSIQKFLEYRGKKATERNELLMRPDVKTTIITGGIGMSLALLPEVATGSGIATAPEVATAMKGLEAGFIYKSGEQGIKWLESKGKGFKGKGDPTYATESIMYGTPVVIGKFLELGVKGSRWARTKWLETKAMREPPLETVQAGTMEGIVESTKKGSIGKSKFRGMLETQEGRYFKAEEMSKTRSKNLNKKLGITGGTGSTSILLTEMKIKPTTPEALGLDQILPTWEEGRSFIGAGSSRTRTITKPGQKFIPQETRNNVVLYEILGQTPRTGGITQIKLADERFNMNMPKVKRVGKPIKYVEFGKLELKKGKFTYTSIGQKGKIAITKGIEEWSMKGKTRYKPIYSQTFETYTDPVLELDIIGTNRGKTKLYYDFSKMKLPKEISINPRLKGEIAKGEIANYKIYQDKINLGREAIQLDYYHELGHKFIRDTGFDFYDSPQSVQTELRFRALRRGVNPQELKYKSYERTGYHPWEIPEEFSADILAKYMHSPEGMNSVMPKTAEWLGKRLGNFEVSKISKTKVMKIWGGEPVKTKLTKYKGIYTRSSVERFNTEPRLAVTEATKTHYDPYLEIEDVSPNKKFRVYYDNKGFTNVKLEEQTRILRTNRIMKQVPTAEYLKVENLRQNIRNKFLEADRELTIKQANNRMKGLSQEPEYTTPSQKRINKFINEKNTGRTSQETRFKQRTKSIPVLENPKSPEIAKILDIRTRPVRSGGTRLTVIPQSKELSISRNLSISKTLMKMTQTEKVGLKSKSYSTPKFKQENYQAQVPGLKLDQFQLPRLKTETITTPDIKFKEYTPRPPSFPDVPPPPKIPEIRIPPIPPWTMPGGFGYSGKNWASWYRGLRIHKLKDIKKALR